MRILLTGGTGFIGGSFARLAAASGHRIAALVRPGKTPPTSPPGLSWLSGSLASAPWSEIDSFQPEVCLHAAWIATPAVYLDSPENEQLARSSREFIRRAAQAGAKRVVVIGTCLEYQMTGGLLEESTTPLAPASPYARCKDRLRRELGQDAAKCGFSLAWARVFYPYGPGEHPARLCSALARKLRRGQKVLLQTPASVKDYIFIEDLAAALLSVVEHEFSGPINIGTGVGVSVQCLADTLQEVMGRSGLVGSADPPQTDPFPRVVADASRLRSLGWSPQTSLAQGLSQLVRRLPE